MSVEIVMPQMGESITEGTISKWLKKVGDTVEKDEAILEISTDKVDAEVPSAGAGVLLEIRHQEGETVEVGTVVAVVGEAGETVSSQPIAEAPKVEEVKQPEPAAEAPKAVEETKSVEQPQAATISADSSATEIVMPQMGESITEGTISKWLKKVGDTIEKDEAILEISTDKVDAEVPSLVGGTLLEIRHQEGETVEVGTVLALVGSGTVGSQPVAKAVETPKVEAPKTEEVKPKTEAVEIPQVKAVAASAGSIEELRQTKSSPLVRNIAKEHGIDLSRIEGTGLSGRVTKKDILSYLDTGAALKPEDLLVKPITSSPSLPSSESSVSSVSSTQSTRPTVTTQSTDKVEPMSNMRKRIAENMVISRKTSAHVTSVYEIDMTRVVKFRDKNKAAFAERFGTKLTFMPFIFQAITQALRKYPIVNSQVDGDKIIYKGDVNLGMAVALDWGLIVPVIKQADTLSLSGLALKANDLADRARTKKLNPDEVQNGTFTITNTGTFGGLFGTPIINQPQVAILNFGTIEKRPKVLTTPDGDDYIAIRSMAYFALTYDHRIVDGADAEKFLSFVKNYLETNQFSI